MRTRIQYGTSLVYPLSTQSCHTSICPNHQTGRTTPFDSRADIAHLGPTGYELDTKQMSEDEKNAVSRQVAAYKETEELILHGDLFRMEDPMVSNYFAFSVVAKDKSEALVTAFRALCICNDENKRVYPRGLDPEARYEIRELAMTLTGSTIMNVGFLLPNDMEDFKTFVFHLRRV
jgi:alpha-galactosidase